MTPRYWARSGHAELLAACAMACLLFLAPSISLAAVGDGVPSRADFRPLGRSDGVSAVPRRAARPQSQRSAGASWRARLPDVTSARAGTRKAVPVTRGQELGLRFRPDDRDPLQGTGVTVTPAPGAPLGQDDNTAFRPMERRARPTYEALENERRAAESMAAPPMAYPGLLPPALPPVRRAWPNW